MPQASAACSDDVFILGNVLSAASTAYGMLLVARIVVASVMVSSSVSQLSSSAACVTEGRKTSAVSLVIAGSTVAGIAGIPLGIVAARCSAGAAFWGLAVAGALVGWRYGC